jgi:tetratricopeptide (TPR) repeat protein
MIAHPDMDKAAKKDLDLLHLVKWADANRKQLITTTAIVVVIGAIIGIFVWHKGHRETQATEALALLKLPNFAGGNTTGMEAEPFVRLADEYPETSGGARARLVAGGILMVMSKPKEAQAQFEKLLADHPGSPMAIQAAIGVAACLEAQDRVKEAIQKYEDLVKRPPNSTTAQAKIALARLYVAQTNLEPAIRLYDEIVRESGGRPDSWTLEARLQGEALVAQNPGLLNVPLVPSTGTKPAAPSVPNVDLPANPPTFSVPLTNSTGK